MRTLNVESGDVDAEILDKYKNFIEAEFKVKCKKILNCLEDHLFTFYKGK